jgi:hypothetical protein
MKKSIIKKIPAIEAETMIPFPPFDYRVYLFFVNNLGEAVKAIIKRDGLNLTAHRLEEISDSGGFHLYSTNRARSYLFLHTDALSNQIVHEAYHTVSNIFRWIEAEHEEEVFAYHLGYLVQEIVSDQKKMLEKRQKRA